jgi:hypothetical protein
MHWNYIDALAYAVALAEPGTDARFDPAKWHQAIYQVLHDHADELSAAFRRIDFEVKEGYPPYSPQVEQFLHVLAESDLLSAPNPAFAVHSMSADQKARIVRLNRDRLADHQDLLRRIGKELVEQLKPGD